MATAVLIGGCGRSAEEKFRNDTLRPLEQRGPCRQVAHRVRGLDEKIRDAG